MWHVGDCGMCVCLWFEDNGKCCGIVSENTQE